MPPLMPAGDWLMPMPSRCGIPRKLQPAPPAPPWGHEASRRSDAVHASKARRAARLTAAGCRCVLALPKTVIQASSAAAAAEGTHGPARGPVRPVAALAIRGTGASAGVICCRRQRKA